MIMMKRICLSKKAIALILALTLLFSSSLSLTSCIFSGNTISEEQYTSLANDLSERVDAGCDRKYSYVADYLNYWGFPAFSKFKIMTIESTYVAHFLDDLGYSDPDRLLALATKAARYYIDNILLTPEGETAFTLDEIRDKRIQTDAIATAYVESVGDKYSNYLNVEMFAALSDSLAGSFAGIGVSVDIDEEAKTITVNEVIAGSATEGAGILPGDILILSGTGYQEDAENILGEELLYDEHPWIGKRLGDVCEGKKVLLVKRGDFTVVPSSQTLLQKDDAVVFSEVK